MLVAFELSKLLLPLVSSLSENLVRRNHVGVLKETVCALSVFKKVKLVIPTENSGATSEMYSYFMLSCQCIEEAVFHALHTDLKMH
jgi:hypothetical protein